MEYNSFMIDYKPNIKIDFDKVKTKRRMTEINNFSAKSVELKSSNMSSI